MCVRRSNDIYSLLEALVFASGFIGDFAASPGQVDEVAPPVVFFTTTTQNVLKFATVALAAALGFPTAVIIVAAAVVRRISKVSNQRQLR